jgi:hypothetical protein
LVILGVTPSHEPVAEAIEGYIEVLIEVVHGWIEIVTTSSDKKHVGSCTGQLSSNDSS